jgi:hypothetical protein
MVPRTRPPCFVMRHAGQVNVKNGHFFCVIAFYFFLSCVMLLFVLQGLAVCYHAHRCACGGGVIDEGVMLLFVLQGLAVCYHAHWCACGGGVIDEGVMLLFVLQGLLFCTMLIEHPFIKGEKLVKILSIRIRAPSA